MSFKSATFMSDNSLSAASVTTATPAPVHEPNRPHRFDPELVRCLAVSPIIILL